MIDWDRLVVESEHNGVIASAGEVALLVGADAAGVTWGNITGDVTQQADLMALVDGYATTDSPQFTGTPRTVTPPAGNNSTRIASTAFVKSSIDSFDSSLGDLAKKDKADYQTDVVNKPTLGALAAKNMANYETDVYNKPTLGALASLNSISYTSNKLTDKPQLGSMSHHDEPPEGYADDSKKMWVRTNVQYDGPKWENFETPDIWTDQDNAYNYMRSSWATYTSADDNGNGIPEVSVTYYHGWKRAGSMALANDVPEVTPGISGRIFELYFRTHGGWVNAINPTMRVDCTNGDDTNGDGSLEHPYKTIMKAINNIYYRGAVQIFPGTYNENISVEGKVVTLLPEPYATGQLVQSVDAEDIVINEISVYNFGSLVLDGNFKVVPKVDTSTGVPVRNSGIVRLQLGSTLIHRTGKLTVDKSWSFTAISNWDNHAIFVMDSCLRVDNLDVTYSQQGGSSAIYVEGIGRAYFDNILANCHISTGTLFRLHEGGFIQYEYIDPESVYANLYRDDGSHALIGGL